MHRNALAASSDEEEYTTVPTPQPLQFSTAAATGSTSRASEAKTNPNLSAAASESALSSSEPKPEQIFTIISGPFRTKESNLTDWNDGPNIKFFEFSKDDGTQKIFVSFTEFVAAVKACTTEEETQQFIEHSQTRWGANTCINIRVRPAPASEMTTFLNLTNILNMMPQVFNDLNEAIVAVKNPDKNDLKLRNIDLSDMNLLSALEALDTISKLNPGLSITITPYLTHKDYPSCDQLCADLEQLSGDKLDQYKAIQIQAADLTVQELANILHAAKKYNIEHIMIRDAANVSMMILPDMPHLQTLSLMNMPNLRAFSTGKTRLEIVQIINCGTPESPLYFDAEQLVANATPPIKYAKSVLHFSKKNTAGSHFTPDTREAMDDTNRSLRCTFTFNFGG
jgi:hypothetical protein